MENIEVALRIRPINYYERENNDIEIWNVNNSETVFIP